MNIQKKNVRSRDSVLQTVDRPKSVRGWQRPSLKTRITTFAIAVSTIPVLGIGAIEFWRDDELLNDRLVKGQETSTLVLADGLSRFMFERHGDVKVLSTKGILSDPQTAAATSLRQKQEILNRFVQAYEVYDHVGFADLSGKILVEVGVSTGSDMGDADYFKKVVQTKQVVISTPKQINVTGRYSVVIAAPVFENETTKLIGVVAARVPVEKMEELFLSDNPTLEKGDHLFIDENGTIFAAAKHQELGVAAAKTFAGFSELAAQKQVKTSIVTSSIDGEKLLTSYSPLRQLPGGPNLNWKLALVQPAKTIQETRLQWWLISLGSTGATAIVVGALAALFARRIIAPVLEATRTLQQLGEGRLDTRLTVRGNDELALLGTHVNQMADRLQTLEQHQRSKAEITQFLRKGSLDTHEHAMQQLVTQAFQHVEATRKVLASTTQLADSMELISQQTNHTSTIAQNAVTTAETSQGTMERAIHEFLTVREKVGHTTKQIKQLRETAQQMAEIVTSMSQITKRSNVLVMNTNLRVTRVGDSSLGLAELAADVGDLAKDITTATETLKQKVEYIQEKTRDVGESMDGSTACVVEGTQLIEATKQNLEQWMGLTTQLYRSIQPIPASMESQMHKSQSVTTLVQDLAQRSEQVSTSFQTLARSLQETTQGLHQLQHEID
jgi:methyl-accepting chemotaxis protein PixJ